MKRLYAIGIILLFISLAIADEPRIENITISPEKPTPLSEITITAEINGENIEEVCMRVEEGNDMYCYPYPLNVSLVNIHTNIYKGNATLIHWDATRILCWPVIKCNGTWYELFEEYYFHDLYPELNISVPEKGYFYLFGKQIGKTFLGNTILVGKTTIIIDVGSYFKYDIENIEFYINDKLKGNINEEPFEWKWKTFSIGKCDIEIRAYVSETNYSFVKTQVIAFIL